MIHLEIWSDIVCPFCYIGKRHLEAALNQFDHRDDVQVVWKSFELNPMAERNPGISVYENLSKKYGQSLAWAKQRTEEVSRWAAAVGLRFDFDRARPANSFDAHRLVRLAARHHLQDRAEERLFAAYFTEGKQIDDPKTLGQLGVDVGLNAEEVEKLLAGENFASEVRQEEEEAFSLGVTGVPFFLFNRKRAVSGAQPVETFLKALRTAWAER
ncbi:MAG: DsbA family oxidoreductase [Candidatus Manganitrophaceae bacterium]|nr:MAG: DsbA family oxidoreductase [Candidatus Manganitrophaceae bacterium]